MKKYILLGISIVFLFAGTTMSGCAFGNFGKANMTYSVINVPSGLIGQGKGDVLKTLGVPDSVAKAGQTEYWNYKNKCGFFVILFGKTLEKDLVLEIVKGKVTSNYLVDKGSSLGIFATQGSVGN